MPKKHIVHGHKKPRTFIWVILIVIIIAAVLIGSTAAGVFESSSQKASKQEQAHNNNQKAAVINNGGVPTTSSDKGSTPSTPYTPPANNNGITITPRTSGNSVIIGTKLVGYSDGTCTLTATNGSKTNTQTADVIYAPNYSTCAGFSIPKATLGPGTWNLTLSVSSGGNTTSKSTTYGVVQ